jgi:hypothetical protein
MPNLKQISVRIPQDIWVKCVHRLVDENIGFQQLLLGVAEQYAEGKSQFELVLPDDSHLAAPPKRG